MFRYFLSKYGLAIVVTAVVIVLGILAADPGEDPMTYISVFGILTYLVCFFVAAKNTKRVVSLVGGTIAVFSLIWYVFSLKPLRRWIRRLRLTGFTPEPYPYLALYGNMADTHAMMRKFTVAPYHDKAPLVKAAVCRLLARGTLVLSRSYDGQAVVMIDGWKDAPSDGIDQQLEQTVYRFMEQSADQQKVVDPKRLAKCISYYKNNEKGNGGYDNQFRFADLLRMGIGRHDYSDGDICHIYGMRRFLRQLPQSWGTATWSSGWLDLRRVAPEYMAYAYLFGMENRVLNNLCSMMGYNQLPMLFQWMGDADGRKAIDRVMKAAGGATPFAEDAVSGSMGRLTLAWHVDEIYDI